MNHGSDLPIVDNVQCSDGRMGLMEVILNESGKIKGIMQYNHLHYVPQNSAVLTAICGQSP